MPPDRISSVAVPALRLGLRAVVLQLLSAEHMAKRFSRPAAIRDSAKARSGQKVIGVSWRIVAFPLVSMVIPASSAYSFYGFKFDGEGVVVYLLPPLTVCGFSLVADLPTLKLAPMSENIACNSHFSRESHGTYPPAACSSSREADRSVR